jgi:integrase
LGIGLLYYTGQRIGDVVRLRHDAVQAGFINLTQQKTGKEVFIPVHRELSRILDATPKRGLTILADEHGRPLKIDRLRNDLQKWAAARGHKVVPHGLRKNAVNALLEAGCNRDEVAAITGQTHEMIGHYSRRVNQRALAGAAIIKWQERK